MQQLTDLIDTLIATDERPTTWTWSANEDMDGGYIECAPAWDSDTKTYCTDLHEIHRKLTMQLAVIVRLDDPRCESCGEPWRLLRSGAVGHCGDENGNDCPVQPA